MGKNESKHECFLVNADLNRALEEQIWKKSTKTGFNLANYNMDQSLSELSICLEEKPDNKDNNIPLKVDLPPMKTDSDAKKMFLFDQDEEKEKGEKEGDSRLNIEEFECGVHFGGTDNAKQEWSFTLYDFDGHGKITKEDLAGLLKALYDAVGSSIKIPNNGTKTLKLRLSVGQDGVSQVNDATKGSSDKNECDSSKKKDNCKNKENVRHRDSPKSKLKDFARLNNLASTPIMEKCNNEAQAAAMSAAMSASKSRLSTQEHKELAELVQENMERNHVKPLRHHHSDCRACLFDHPHTKRRHRGMRTTNSTRKDNAGSKLNNSATNNSAGNSPEKKEVEEAPKESQDRRKYYLDLVGIENTSSMFPGPATLGQSTALNMELNNSPRTQRVTTATALCAERVSGTKHFRSRSHELGERKCDNTKQETETCQKVLDNGLKPDHLRSNSLDTQKNSNVANVRAKGNPKTMSGRRPVRFRPVSLPADVPEAVSPHYHRRHRHREKDHDFAMQQVAEWIEREHTMDIDGDKIVIQRHEHHHVHEHHHHHHYHHYYEA